MTLEGVTIPTPAAYNADEPFQQHENLCYVLLQLAQKLQAADTDIDLVGAIVALAGSYQELDLGDMFLRISPKNVTISTP